MVYLLQVARPKCSGDVELPLHLTIEDGVAIIQMLAHNHLLHYNPDSINHILMIEQYMNESHDNGQISDM